MRVFVAGAAGAIGRQLVPMLIAAGHQVTGTTRSEERARWLRGVGATAAIVDVYDTPALHRAVIGAQPDVVIHQLTDLAGGFDRENLARHTRLRQVGTRHLVEAMLAAGARRLVAQSGAWLYAPGRLPHIEDDPLRDPAQAPDDLVLPGIIELERLVTQTPGIDGVVLRYGLFYGEGAARDTPGAGPTVGVVDAARAAVLALEHGPPGIYNIVDDGGAVSNRRAGEVLGWRPMSRSAPTAGEQTA
jgi:nucleoside-diphosphate-sugar epimerase